MSLQYLVVFGLKKSLIFYVNKYYMEIHNQKKSFIIICAKYIVVI